MIFFFIVEFLQCIKIQPKLFFNYLLDLIGDAVLFNTVKMLNEINVLLFVLHVNLIQNKILQKCSLIRLRCF